MMSSNKWLFDLISIERDHIDWICFYIVQDKALHQNVQNVYPIGFHDSPKTGL